MLLNFVRCYEKNLYLKSNIDIKLSINKKK